MDNLIGNRKAKRTLAAWTIGGRLPHAVLLEGEPGCGRGTFAQILAGVILCDSENTRPCGNCKHCVKVRKGIHPDFETFQGGSGKNSFHAEAVREMRTDAYIRPNEADARVFLLKDAQNMSVQAQNALLKIIEEPPAGVHFILTCEMRGQLLPTIQSRAAVVMLEAVDTEECEEYLRGIMPDQKPQAIRAAAVRAGGNIGKAKAFLSDESALREYEAAERALHSLIMGDELSALEYFYEFERAREGFIQSLQLMRRIAGAFLPDNNNGIVADPSRPALSPHRTIQIIDIMDDAISSAGANASVPLLTVFLCGKISDLCRM